MECCCSALTLTFFPIDRRLHTFEYREIPYPTTVSLLSKFTENPKDRWEGGITEKRGKSFRKIGQTGETI